MSVIRSHGFMLYIFVASVAAQAVQAPTRAKLTKLDVKLETPKTYAMRERRDPKTGGLVTYDPLPRVAFIESRAGIYDLSWIGEDGTRKRITYQRPDSFDAIVRVDVTALTSGGYRYVYSVENLAASGSNIRGFAVQTFSSTFTPIAQANVHVGQMKAPEFSAGTWWRFGLRPASPAESTEIAPGQLRTFEADSAGPPGLVECRAHGPLGMRGVGEEMPMALENLLLGYSAWPHGKTVGPMNRLIGLSAAQKVTQLHEWLPQFQVAGWISPPARTAYEEVLKGGDLQTLVPLVNRDVTSRRISSEVAAIVRGLAR